MMQKELHDQLVEENNTGRLGLLCAGIYIDSSPPIMLAVILFRYHIGDYKYHHNLGLPLLCPGHLYSQRKGVQSRET